MSTDTWNPDQYERFKAERAQPWFDLLALVDERPDMRVVDLGCGTGELTRELHRQLRARSTVGVDNSAAMLEASHAFLETGLEFVQADIATFTPDAPVDLVFSNAALQWLPDHPALFARLTRCLAKGGQLAVQMPANFDHVSHRLADEIAGREPYRTALAGWTGRGVPVAPPEDYAVLLHALGFARQRVDLRVYAHLLASTADVVEWVKGTLLTPFAQRLGPDLYARFVGDYRDELLARAGDHRPYLYPFKRLLLWGAHGD